MSRVVADTDRFYSRKVLQRLCQYQQSSVAEPLDKSDWKIQAASSIKIAHD
ncbi:hypothetical protein [Pseudomonas sp.]|uniref:hypothetical protein n=1 Tax=Pseudomonas sp. TaxID=306 RepID=UPI003A982FA7